MVDEGTESARFVLQHMRGVSPSSSSPAFPDTCEGRRKEGDFVGGTRKDLGSSSHTYACSP